MVQQATGSVSPLGPRPELLPPAGCRGAVSSWPQFIDALQVLNGLNWSAPPWSGLARQFGGPAQLVRTLAASPLALQHGDGPLDVYGRYARMTAVVSLAATMAGATLSQFQNLTAHAGTGADDLLRDLLSGDGGLAEKADAVADFADRFSAWLRSINPGADSVDEALAGFHAADAGLADHAKIAEALKTRQLSQFEAATRAAADGVRDSLTIVEVAAANVTVTAVYAHLIEAVEALAAGWRDVAATYRSAVANAPPGRLATRAWLTEALGVDDSAAAWTAFADVVRAFTASLLVRWDQGVRPSC